MENDRLRVSKCKLRDISTRHEMLSALAGQFDPLKILAPCMLEGKLTLQKVVTLGLGSDDKLPDDILKDWHKWVEFMDTFTDVSIPCYCFPEGHVLKGVDNYYLSTSRFL